MFRRVGNKSRVGIVAVGLLASSALVLSGSGPAAAGDEDGRAYLALGDSVVFGFITQAGFEYAEPDNFIGYPAYVGNALNLDAVNASCPGEATSGFINVTGADNGCHTSYRAHFPLHVPYSGPTESQLSFATDFLSDHRDTKLVTVSAGANDAFILQDSCATAVSPPACIAAGLPPVLGSISANMGTILKALRATHFHGMIVVVNYYSLDYSDAAGTGLTLLLNQAETATASTYGAFVADAFTAFKTAPQNISAGGKTCNAGLLNPEPGVAGKCDVHPSQTGQQLLASTVEEVYEAHSH